jgi:hypothetical protein
MLNAAEMSDEKDSIEKEKKELSKKLSEAKKAGADRQMLAKLQGDLMRMG